MEGLHFTTRVLGPVAAYRPEKHLVTQTLRSESSPITSAIMNGMASAGDQLEIRLDGILTGHAELIIMDAVTWTGLDIDDAHRGGFDSLEDLAEALKRAGYRFQPINSHGFYRIQFSWLEGKD